MAIFSLNCIPVGVVARPPFAVSRISSSICLPILCMASNTSSAGILLTMCEARTILCKTIVEEVEKTFDGELKVFKSRIPNTVKVGESIYYGEPLLEYAPESKACAAYQGLAREVIAYEG